MSLTTFDRVELRGEKRVKCEVCGKSMGRRQTFWMTLNPWNKDPETDLPRTREQCYAALRDEVAVWRAKPERHLTCEPTR